ncbi:hypothetical protein BDV06DRAFT_215511 [Aspergillus oleicola]
MQITNVDQVEHASQTEVADEKTAVYEHDAVRYREYRESLHIEITPKQNSRVRWKIDAIILPVFLVTHALQLLDKTALNYANILGYEEALGLEGQQFNYISAMVYAGYFFGQYPCGWLVGRFPAQRVLGISCFLWGLMVIILTQCRSYSSALGVRFIMGIFEAAVIPGLNLMTGFWYTRHEIPLRQCIWYSALGWGGIVGSYISFGIAKMSPDTKPERWEALFFILGGVTCLWAFLIFFGLPDSPSTAFFLSKEERIIAVKRVSANETGIKNKSFNKKQALTAFIDPKTILLFIAVFAAAIPNGVVNSFSTIIIQDMGFSTEMTTELKSVGDAVQIVGLIIGRIITLNVPNSRILTATAANILCTVAARCMAYLPRHLTWQRLICFWLVNTQSVGFTVSLVTVSSNMAGYTHRAMANALIFTAYCWGNYAGPFVVRPPQDPEYKGAMIGLLVGYLIKTACHFGLLVYLFTVNRYRDWSYGPADKANSDEVGMQDKTEFENPDFRYVL